MLWQSTDVDMNSGNGTQMVCYQYQLARVRCNWLSLLSRTRASPLAPTLKAQPYSRICSVSWSSLPNRVVAAWVRPSQSLLGSGWFCDLHPVDKIIIAQESLSKFINKVSPGAYTSLTKVDFKTLDDSIVQPIGVYGSRESIVALFLGLGIVDSEQWILLFSV